MSAELIAQLRRDEGVRYRAYYDSRGIPTIGVGHNIKVGDDIPLTDGAVDAILAGDLRTVQSQAAAFPWFAELDPVRQGAVLNMLFNLGPGNLGRFRQMIGALEERDWAAAAGHALDSLWARQVGARSHRLAEQLRTGEWQ